VLVNPKQMILEAKKGGYAIGCFNTSDLEITKAIIAAAVAENAPVMISTSEKAIEYAGLEEISLIVIEAAREVQVPVALHLDHGQSIRTVEKCIRAGYTSIMFDGSGLALEENEIKTRHAVELTHHASLACEGELGHLGKAGPSTPLDDTRGRSLGVNVNSSDLTDPEDVSGFIQRTGVDFLAVSIGSQHGSQGTSSEKIDIELLKKIAAETSVPLVLHGASGVGDADVQAAVKNGIAKINIDTDIRKTFTNGLRQALDGDPREYDPREVFSKAMLAVQQLVEAKIKLFGSSGKAKI